MGARFPPTRERRGMGQDSACAGTTEQGGNGNGAGRGGVARWGAIGYYAGTSPDGSGGSSIVQQFTTQQIRNVALLGHSGGGQDLARRGDAFRVAGHHPAGARGGRQRRLGLRARGAAQADEPATGGSPLRLEGVKINVTTRPATRISWARRSRRCARSTRLCSCWAAPSGVEVGAETAWERLRDAGVPTVAFVNKMDREHADYEGRWIRRGRSSGASAPPSTFRSARRRRSRASPIARGRTLPPEWRMLSPPPRINWPRPSPKRTTNSR